jgi:hypothetical protein
MVAQIRPDFIVTENVERYLSFIKSDDERPPFLLYPYLTVKPVAYSPSREFVEVFSAIMSFPRKRYREFANEFGRPHNVVVATEYETIPRL